MDLLILILNSILIFLFYSYNFIKRVPLQKDFMESVLNFVSNYFVLINSFDLLVKVNIHSNNIFSPQNYLISLQVIKNYQMTYHNQTFGIFRSN